MQQIDQGESGSVIGGLFVMAAIVVLLQFTVGCGPILGMREADLWGAKFTFSEGMDVHAGMNAIDRVDDRRGVTRIAKSENSELPGQGY